ncbi:MAG: helix-turn-helix domain-containing protein [Bryobacteraceae bacterium]|nr:helix-turn-helix domain-containing protein [Bryobacteraceae bacterium]
MFSAHSHLSFGALHQRLIQQVRLRLFNGELTERRLARMIGVSQPHVHNVLKGVRSLTTEVADLLLAGLGLSTLDLIETAEAGGILQDRQYEVNRIPLAPVISTPLGPGCPVPRFGEAIEWVPLPAHLWRQRRRLALSRLVPDPCSPLPAAHDFVLICLDESARLSISPADLAVIQWRGSARIRRARVEDRKLIILAQADWLAPDEPAQFDLREESLLASVRAVVLWSGRDFRRASPLDYMGSFLENPASR